MQVCRGFFQNMVKKKLLIATDGFLPRWDGISRFLTEVIPHLEETFDITILAPKWPQSKSKFRNIPIIRIPLRKWKIGDMKLAKLKFKKIAKEVKKSDVVWTHTVAPISFLAKLYAKRYGKRCVSTVHTIDWEYSARCLSYKNPLKKISYLTIKLLALILYNLSDLVMVPSFEVAEIYSKNGIKTKKVIVPLGVDIEKFKPAENKSAAKEAIGFSSEDIIVGYTGRIGREKDLITLYRAFLRIRRKNPKLKLLVVGSGVKSIEKLFDNKPGVKRFDSTNNIIPYLQAMDLYVLPSLTETTSLSTMEAMACGVVPICTPVGCVKDYIKRGYNGFFFPLKDSYTLAKKIDSLANNKLLRHEISINAMATIKTHYFLDNTISKIKYVLSRI